MTTAQVDQECSEMIGKERITYRINLENNFKQLRSI